MVAATTIDIRAISETGYEPHPLSIPEDLDWTEDQSFAMEETSYADELAEAAGRLCYLSWNRPNPKTATNEGYLANILDHGHYSVLEHASVTLYVEGVSRALLLELERHRFLSFSVVSQRYVDHSEAEFVLPPAAVPLLDEVANPQDYPEYHWTWRQALEDYNKENRFLYRNFSEFLTERGLDRKTARGAARAVLPEGTETKFFVTGNLRAWRDIIQKRNSEHADQEIREFAQEVLKILKEYAPNSLGDM